MENGPITVPRSHHQVLFFPLEVWLERKCPFSGVATKLCQTKSAGVQYGPAQYFTLLPWHLQPAAL